MEKAPLLLPQNPIHNQKVSHCVVVIKNFKNKEKEIDPKIVKNKKIDKKVERDKGIK